MDYLLPSFHLPFLAAERFALLAGGRAWTKLREQDCREAACSGVENT